MALFGKVINLYSYVVLDAKIVVRARQGLLCDWPYTQGEILRLQKYRKL